MAQVQKPRCSSKVTSRRCPLSGSSAQTRPVVWALHHRAAQGQPAGGEHRSGPGVPRGVQHRGGVDAFAVDPGGQGGQHRQSFPGSLVHPGLALGSVFLVRHVAGADRAAHRPGRPSGRVVVGPLGDVEVERPNRGHHAPTVQPGRHLAVVPAVSGGGSPGFGHHPLLPGGGDVAGQLQ